MSFDRLARHYRWMERILAGDKLQRCRTTFLSEIESPGRILLMGEGPGRFLEICRKQFPSAQFTVVDASAEMLNVAHREGAAGLATNPVRFIRCDCLAWDPGLQPFDLIATHFFLDCFTPEQLAVVIPKLARVLAKGGAWLVSDFKVPERGWRRMRAQVIHAIMYAFFRRVTGLRSTCVTSPDRYLVESGLRLERRREWDWGLIHADLWRKVD